MKKQENKCGLTSILMLPAIRVIESLSQSPIQIDFKINLIPDKDIPDFPDLQNALRQGMEGKKLGLDQAVRGVYEIIRDTYNPLSLQVTGITRPHNLFFPVELTIASEPVQSPDKTEPDKGGKKNQGPGMGQDMGAGQDRNPSPKNHNQGAAQAASPNPPGN
jgi:hypothetical protein